MIVAGAGSRLLTSRHPGGAQSAPRAQRRSGPAERRSVDEGPRGAAPLSPHLDGLVHHGAEAPASTHAADAARAFSAGNGYLTGQIIDRAL